MWKTCGRTSSSKKMYCILAMLSLIFVPTSVAEGCVSLLDDLNGK